ncbi:MAG: hypothetical protein LQ347_005688, partial [Umbilicaria vellea]
MVERIQKPVHEFTGDEMTEYASPNQVDDGDDKDSDGVGAKGLSTGQLRVVSYANAPQGHLLLADTAEGHDLNECDERIDHVQVDEQKYSKISTPQGQRPHDLVRRERPRSRSWSRGRIQAVSNQPIRNTSNKRQSDSSVIEKRTGHVALAIHIGGSRDRKRRLDLGEDASVLASDTHRPAVWSQ